ncbi:MAG: M20/M25/M40 family metallo-hydrolase [Nitrospiraceae bacterium]
MSCGRSLQTTRSRSSRCCPFPRALSPTDSEFFRVLKEVANGFDPGTKVTTPLLVLFTDCHYFREKGIPCYGFMPFKLTDKEAALLHGNDERLSVQNVKFGTRVMYEIVRKLAAQ